MSRFTLSPHFIFHVGWSSRYASNHLDSYRVLYPLSSDICCSVCFPIIHHLNHTNLFVFDTSLRRSVKTLLQFLHLKRCLPACLPHLITSKKPHCGHLSFLFFDIKKVTLMKTISSKLPHLIGKH